MEVVNVFNKELKSILEAKLPVSRHKMSLITKSAMKALKFYKHVVQSVEKFIAKCGCDYKVPGLYVIDAIVRQSKHQYCDKDVFVPRFMRNIVTTFIYLSQCDPKDVPSIERVLRLWQQNGVFPTDLVEALLEIVYDSSDADKIMKATNIVTRLVNEWNTQKGKPEEKLDTFMPPTDLFNQNQEAADENSINKMEGGLIDSITKLLTKFHAETGQDVSAEINQIQTLHQKIVEQSALLAQGQMIDADTLSQLHQSMEELTKKAAKAAAVQQSKLAMLSNDDKDNANESSNDMEFVEQLQQMVDTLAQTRALQNELQQAMEDRQKTDTDKSHNVSFNEDKDLRRPIKIEDEVSSLEVSASEPPIVSVSGDIDMRILSNHSASNYRSGAPNASENGSIKNEKISRSPSMSSNKRRRSDSESRASKRKRSKSKERKKKEKRIKEMRKKYQPALRSNQVGITSHTIFIGHLNKHLSETKLRNECEEFGEIMEFNMIPPRGCAFVTFSKRKSAHKAIGRMHEKKFEGRELKVAWAPNKGIKDDKELREHWVEAEGCTYVPVDQFPINRASELTEGHAEVDDDSIPEELRQAIANFDQQKKEALERGMGPTSVETMISVAAEVANQNIPTSLADLPIDAQNAHFFAQFPPPPPMMPPQMMSPYMSPHFMGSGLPPPPPNSPMMDKHNGGAGSGSHNPELMTGPAFSHDQDEGGDTDGAYHGGSGVGGGPNHMPPRPPFSPFHRKDMGHPHGPPPFMRPPMMRVYGRPPLRYRHPRAGFPQGQFRPGRPPGSRHHPRHPPPPRF